MILLFGIHVYGGSMYIQYINALTVVIEMG